MTDRQPLGRIDLRAIDEPTDPRQADRVIGNVLRQVLSKNPVGPADLLSRLGGLIRPAIAAAAILLFGASVTLRRMNDRSAGTPPPLTSVWSWAEAGRVPTNGELLAAFEGYDR